VEYDLAQTPTNTGSPVIAISLIDPEICRFPCPPMRTKLGGGLLVLTVGNLLNARRFYFEQDGRRKRVEPRGRGPFPLK